MVEFIADDTVMWSVRAGDHSSDLVARGVGDGRHAFMVRLGDRTIPADATLLSAREVDSGRIFGRLRLRAPRAADARLERLAASLDTLRAALRRPAGRRPGIAHAGFAMVGARLACSSDECSGAASRLLARAYPPAKRTIPDPLSAGPRRGTVVLWARRAEEAAAATAALRLAAKAYPVEIFIVDAGQDARTSLLPTIFADTTFLHRPGGFSLDAAIWSAASDARGGFLVLLDGNGDPLSATMLSEIVDQIDDARIVVNRAVAGLLSSVGEPADIAAPSASGLLLAVDRKLFERVGGLDPSISGDPTLAVADFCMRAALLGAWTVWPAASAPGPPSATRIPVPAAVAAFRKRWGRFLDAGQG